MEVWVQLRCQESESVAVMMILQEIDVVKMLGKDRMVTMQKN